MISVTGIWLQTHFRGVDVKHLSKAHPVSNMLLFIYNLVFSECEKKGCKDISCRHNWQQAVEIDKSRGIYGYLSEVLFRILFEKYLLVQHLWVNHILLADNPERSKFLAKYACVKDLHKLIVAGVRIAITKRKIIKCICRNGKNITYYYTKFTTAVGSYIDPTRGLLYQFTICIIFEDGSLANAFPFGKGFRVQVKPKKEKSSGGFESGEEYQGDSTDNDDETFECYDYPSTSAHRGSSQKRKKRQGRKSKYIHLKVHPAHQSKPQNLYCAMSSCKKYYLFPDNMFNCKSIIFVSNLINLCPVEQIHQ